MSTNRSQRLTVTSLVLAMIVAACAADPGPSSTTRTGGSASSTPESGAPLTVVATTTILGDIVGNIIGEDADLEVLLPVGADPHDYQVSSQQVALLAEADLVVANGLLLEEGMMDAIEAAEAEGTHVLEVAEAVDPIPFGSHEHHEEGEEHEEEPAECDPTLGHEGEEEGGHEHAEGSCDPHFWTDPLRVASAARLIAAELSEIDDAAAWGERAESYADELTALDAEIVALLEAIPEENRKLITNHDAIGYFANRYDLEVVGTVIPGGSTLADPSSAELAEMVELIQEEGVRAIFAESIDASALAETVAAEAGRDIQVVELFTDSLGQEGTGAETVIGLLRTDAHLIADALS